MWWKSLFNFQLKSDFLFLIKNDFMIFKDYLAQSK